MPETIKNQSFSYQLLGYRDRYDYFTNLSKAYKVPIMDIILKAEQLGVDKDFSELVEWVASKSGVI